MNQSSPNHDPFDSEQVGRYTRPLSSRGFPRWLVFLLAALGLLYILNPTMGIFEFIPDNLPIVGNLDDGLAAILLWFGIIELVESARQKRTEKKQP